MALFEVPEGVEGWLRFEVFVVDGCCKRELFKERGFLEAAVAGLPREVLLYD